MENNLSQKYLSAVYVQRNKKKNLYIFVHAFAIRNYSLNVQ